MQDGRHAVYKAKVTVLGQYAVGKTSIATQFAKQHYEADYHATVGASFMSRKISVDNRTYMFQLWDTAGTERYRSVVPMYLRDTNAAIVIYDVTDTESFEELNLWLDQLFKYAPLEVVVAIVGNKMDLVDERVIPFKRGKDFAALRKYIFMETSAKTGENIQELFLQIAKNLRWRTRLSQNMDDHDHPIPESEGRICLDNAQRQPHTSSRCCSRSTSTS